jgi:hypothetical protein
LRRLGERIWHDFPVRSLIGPVWNGMVLGNFTQIHAFIAMRKEGAEPPQDFFSLFKT